MPDLLDGQSVEVQGSARSPYVLKNIGGVFSCSCPAWRNQSVGIERRTCKHLRMYRSEEAEAQRIGKAMPLLPLATSSPKTQAPPLLLAHTWNNETDITDWWLSEKLDGVRAYWDGICFQSRLGNAFHAPAWFTESLPTVPLDGELWLARKAFQRTVSIVRRHDQNAHWKQLSFVVFDAPAVEAPFETRQAFLQTTFREQLPTFARVLEQERCKGISHLRESLTRIETLGGEGLMLRQPRSPYEVGRSATLLKVKSFHEADALVVDHQPGSGRHRGRLGALVVELPNGKRFCVGTGLTDAQRNSPPAIGRTITFRYQEWTDGGIPRFPSFVRMRTDLV